MRVWQSKTPAYISHTFFLRRPRGFNTTGPFLMCDLFWNLLSKQPYILQLLHFNSLSRRREHQTSTAPPGLAAGIGRHRDLHRSPLRFLTSTPKPRAEGSSPSAPAKNRRKHCVSAGFLFTCVVWLWCSRWFRHRFIAPGCTRSHLFPSSPAPKTHPVLPFSGFSGCVFLFFAVFLVQNFRAGFCASCRIVVTS